MSTIKTDHLLALVQQARAPGKVLVITGYRSTEDGKKTVRCRPIPKGGYKKLIAESLEILRSGVPAEKVAAANPDLWAEAGDLAVEAKIAAFERTLARDDPPDQKGRQPDLVFDDDDFNVAHDAKGPSIHHLYVVEEIPTPDPDDPPRPKSTKSRPDVILKRALEAELPVGHYLARLNLHPGKYSKIEVQNE